MHSFLLDLSILYAAPLVVVVAVGFIGGCVTAVIRYKQDGAKGLFDTWLQFCSDAGPFCIVIFLIFVLLLVAGLVGLAMFAIVFELHSLPLYLHGDPNL